MISNESPNQSGQAVDFLGFTVANRVLRRFAESVSARRIEVAQRRRIIRELSMYTDQELAELGFSRGDIPAVASGSFRI